MYIFLALPLQKATIPKILQKAQVLKILHSTSTP